MKLRVIDLEMDDAAAASCVDAIRLLVAGSGAPQSAVVPSVLPASPAPLAIEATRTENPPIPSGRKPKSLPHSSRKQKAVERAAPGPVSAPAGVHEGSAADQILQALRKRPLSSLELIAVLKCESAPHRVYQSTGSLKEKGLIEGRNDDDGDGTRRWFITKR